jgi:hypothetical protein
MNLNNKKLRFRKKETKKFEILFSLYLFGYNFKFYL